MKRSTIFIACLFITCLWAAVPCVFSKETDYDFGNEEEARGKSDKDSPVTGIAKGIKQVAYEGPKDLLAETAEEAPKKPPVVNVIEGVNRGTQKLVDNTIKGAYRVATLGTSELESYEVEEPEKGSGEPTKFKISLPGT